MTFKLSERSLNNLEGVKFELQEVVKRAIEITKVDFGVTEGLRTRARQAELVAKGASQSMQSKHLTGDAVDVVAYIGSNVQWELSLYDDIANAFKAAAEEFDIPVRWGGAWTVPDITKYEGNMQEALDEYVDTRRSQSRRPFIDGPHFELV